jgi:catechol 2,3-dioxygenase-like lactoylglutathione lyase family enzyme
MNSKTNKKISAGSLHHVTIGVTNLEASIDFYSEGLGLRKTLDSVVGGAPFERLLRLPGGSTARTVFLQGETRVGQIELVEWRTGLTQNANPQRPGSIGPSVLSFSVSAAEFTQVLLQLKEAGAVFWGEPIVSILDGYGEITASIVEDPDGNVIEIVRLPSDEEIHRFRNSS